MRELTVLLLVFAVSAVSNAAPRALPQSECRPPPGPPPHANGPPHGHPPYGHPPRPPPGCEPPSETGQDEAAAQGNVDYDANGDQLQNRRKREEDYSEGSSSGSPEDSSSGSSGDSSSGSPEDSSSGSSGDSSSGSPEDYGDDDENVDDKARRKRAALLPRHAEKEPERYEEQGEFSMSRRDRRRRQTFADRPGGQGFPQGRPGEHDRSQHGGARESDRQRRSADHFDGHEHREGHDGPREHVPLEQHASAHEYDRQKRNASADGPGGFEYHESHSGPGGYSYGYGYSSGDGGAGGMNSLNEYGAGGEYMSPDEHVLEKREARNFDAPGEAQHQMMQSTRPTPPA